MHDPNGPRTLDVERIWGVLSDVVRDGIIVTDADLDRPGPTILWVNDAIVRTTGFSRDELIGASPRMFQGPGTDRAELDRIREHLTRGEGVRAELVNVTKDGREFVVELDVTPVRDASGTVTNLVAIQRDVTGHRLRERWFRALVEHSAELVSVTAPDGIVSYVSPSVEAILGWRPDEFVGRSGAEFVHPDDAPRLVAGLRAKGRREGSNPPVEFRFRAKDGSWRWVEAVTTNLLDEPAVRAMVVNARDVTDRKVLEDELRHVQKMDAIGRLAGGVAHDFNNLIQVIDGRTELALAELPDAHPARDHLRAVLAAASRATELTKQLLTIGRDDRSTPQVVELDEAVAESASLLQRLLAVDVELAVELGAPGARVLVNREQLGQVVLNLALNARDSMPGGGRLTIRTALGPAAPAEGELPTRRDLDGGDYVTISVRDTGTGIDPDVLPHVFEPFFTTRAGRGGSGLGLPIVYGIAHQSGGAVDVESELGTGTTFSVHLPVAP